MGDTGDTFMVFFKRPTDEPAAGFGKRLRDVAAEVAADDRATAVVLLVDDGDSGAPPEASAYPASYDAALVASGVPADALPEGDAAFAVTRRVIKARDRGRDGARTPGFTVICPSVRFDFLTHDQFDAHWRDNHSKVHVASSPGTVHYEQLIIDDALTRGAPQWDGVGLLSFGSAEDYTERLFDGERGQQAIFEDVKKFVDLEKGETVPATEYVYRDDA